MRRCWVRTAVSRLQQFVNSQSVSHSMGLAVLTWPGAAENFASFVEAQKEIADLELEDITKSFLGTFAAVVDWGGLCRVRSLIDCSAVLVPSQLPWARRRVWTC